MKRALAALVGIAFVFASAGLASAQTPAPAMKPEEKKMEKMEKKAPHHTAMGTVKTAVADGIVVAGKAKG